MAEKANGYIKLAGVFVAVLGLVFGMITWSAATYATKSEVKTEIVYVRNDISEMKGSLREIRLDVKELLKVLN